MRVAFLQADVPGERLECGWEALEMKHGMVRGVLVGIVAFVVLARSQGTRWPAGGRRRAN